MLQLPEVSLTNMVCDFFKYHELCSNRNKHELYDYEREQLIIYELYK